MSTYRFFTYENKLLLLLSFIFGFVLFDRMALNYLVPFFDKELRLNNTQIGLLNSLLAVGWAISGYFIGTLSDKTGKRKRYLIVAVVIFSISSFFSGLAATFSLLLLARIIMGFSEGPVLPLAQSIMVSASSLKRRGFNTGFVQGFMSNLFAMLAPIILVTLATKYGWRNAFFIAGVPGLLLAAIAFFLIKESKTTIKKTAHRTSVTGLLKYRNVWIAILLSCCAMTWLFAQVTFMPKYVVTVLNYTKDEMGKTMSVLGFGAIVWGIIIPILSDKFGRKPIIIIFFLLSTLVPVSLIYTKPGYLHILPFIFLGSSILGCVPLVLATIPSETVPRKYITQTLGFVMGVGELVGGVFTPAVAGWSADRFGLGAPFLIAAGAAVIGSIIGYFLLETAPALSTS
jgi:MFS family permease